MIHIRKAEARGHFNHGWLDTYHTFSFADYFDPRFMNFRALRVINEDKVAAGAGFPTHPHKDMEIITYILEGELQHKDSMGNGTVIRSGEVQRMTAGTGVTHSEFNPSPKNPVHLLQIWILPGQPGLKPGYEQKAFPESGRKNRLQLVASPGGEDGSVTIHQDVRLSTGILEPGKSVQYDLAEGRHAWVQVARGQIRLNGVRMEASDGASVSEEKRLTVTALSPAEVLLFELS